MEAHLAVAHLAFDFTLRRQCGHGVDDDDVDGSRSDEVLGDFQGLLAVVGLRDEQVLDVDAQLGGIEAVEGMFRIDEGGYATFLLCLSDDVQGQGRLTRAFRAVDLDDTAFGQTAHAQGIVEADGARGNALHLLSLSAKAHDASLAKALLDVT